MQKKKQIVEKERKRERERVGRLYMGLWICVKRGYGVHYLLLGSPFFIITFNFCEVTDIYIYNRCP